MPNDPRIDEILAGLYECDDHAAYLARATERYPDLAEELRGHADLLDLVDRSFGPSAEPAAPELIDRYHIERVLGRGGMGVVYLATQELPIRRQLALKVLGAHVTAPQARARFELERESLARMDHPNIARVVDAGVTPDGTPFVAMEYVRGTAITTYCREHGLGLRARLEMFATVCEAVNHAHQKGVIHRDIKPSNVLVGEVDREPVPKVIDFGLAKPFGEELSRAHVTVGGQVLGTPAYMSPEQASGRGDVDVRADVYSLGVLLYELLVGDIPWSASDTAEDVAALLQRILHEEPSRPSTRLSQGRHRSSSAGAEGLEIPTWERRLRGDLDWITLKALAKDPAERYASAHDLAEDIRRHLRNEPVVAGPPSTGYRVRKFVRRHRVSVVAGGAVILALATGLLVSLAKSREASEARIEAEAARHDAEELLDFMLVDLKDGLEPLGRLDLLESVAERALAYYADGARSGWRDEARRATALRLVGEVLRDQGRSEDALRSLRRSLELWEALCERHPDRLTWRAHLADGHNRIAGALLDGGDLDGAAAAGRRSLEIAESLQAHYPDASKPPLMLIAGHHLLGDVLLRKGDLDGALSRYRTALSLGDQHRMRHPSFGRACGHLHREIGRILEGQGDAEGAFAEYEASSSIWEDLREADPQSAKSIENLASARLRQAHLLQSRGAHEAAEPHGRESVKLHDRLAERDPHNAKWRESQIEALLCLGDVRRDRGDAEEAMRLYARALSVGEDLASRGLGGTGLLQNLAAAQSRIGGALEAQGNLRDALGHMEAWRNIQEDVCARDPENAIFRRNLGMCFLRQGIVLQALGRGEAAAQSFTRSLDILGDLTRLDPTNAEWKRSHAEGSYRLGRLLTSLGRHAEGVPHLHEALNVLEQALLRDPANGRVLENACTGAFQLGDSLAALERHEDALEAYQRALSIAVRRRDLRSEDVGCQSDVGAAHLRLATLFRESGDSERALASARQGLEIFKGICTDHPDYELGRRNMAVALEEMGSACLELGNTTEALSCYVGGVEIRADLAKAHPADPALQGELAEGHQKVASALHRLGQRERALDQHRRSLTIHERLAAAAPDDDTWQQRLADDQVGVGSLLAQLGEKEQALTLAREALETYESLLDEKRRPGPSPGATTPGAISAMRTQTETLIHGLTLETGERPPEDSPEHLARAMALAADGKYASSVEHFTRALEDERLRADLDAGYLYKAACAAALALPDAEEPAIREALLERALTLLREDLQRRSARLRDVQEGGDRAAIRRARASCQRHATSARTGDPRLASLRGTPAFDALFADLGLDHEIPPEGGEE